MRIKNDQAGLTLVELLVTIVVASIVTLSACTMLLFGLRINNQSTKTSMGQNTVQVLMEALEDVAAEAKDLNVVSNPDSWEIKEGDKVLFSYVSEKQTVYSGQAFMKSGEQMVEIGTPFLKDIFASSVAYEDQLLTIDVQTAQDNYSTSIYCRMGGTNDPAVDTTGDDIIAVLLSDKSEGFVTGTLNNEERLTFLKVLATQYGSRGQVREKEEDEDVYKDTSLYYAVWYKQTGNIESEGWGKNTPWCACYISWVLAQPAVSANVSAPSGRPHWYADVNDFVNYFGGYKSLTTSANQGDLIFFDFDDDDPADHVGVYLGSKVIKEKTYIYTIEGNTAGKVAVRKYAVDDPRIMGYGVLSWN